MKTKQTEFHKHYIVSVILFLAANLLMIGISAFLIQNETIKKSMEIYIIPAILFLSSLISSVYLSKVENEKILIKTLIMSAASVLIIILISAIFTLGGLNLHIENIISIILGYIAVPIVHNKKNTGVNKGKYKYKYG